MLPSSEAIPNDSPSRLHSEASDRAPEIAEILHRAQQARAPLESRLNLALERQRAEIEAIDASGLRTVSVGVDDIGGAEQDLRFGIRRILAIEVDVEERGIFQVWDTDEIVARLREAGFRDVETGVSFGDPPQAIVASAARS